ncbi:gfo/Idh/MocA family oxidoreductase [bacterium]|nr:gfo/Idh/MocA family oxidoreductase [bacterium]
MTKRLKVGVIGLGNMGRHHVKHWGDVPGATVVAVVDIDAERRRNFESNGVTGYSSIDKLIESKSVDLVSVTSPTSLHFEHAQMLLEAGVHVLVEKPIAPTAAEGRILSDLAARKNLILQVGHIERFNPAIAVLSQWLTDGGLGRPISFSSERVSPLPVQIFDADVLVDLAVHDLDIMAMVLGKHVTHLSTVFTSARLPDRPDSAIISVQYSKAIASISVGWNSPVRNRSASIYFENALVKIDFLKQSIEKIEFDDPSRNVVIAPSAFVPPLIGELSAFLTSVNLGQQPVVSGEAGIFAVELVERAKKNAV